MNLFYYIIHFGLKAAEKNEMTHYKIVGADYKQENRIY